MNYGNTKIKKTKPKIIAVIPAKMARIEMN